MLQIEVTQHIPKQKTFNKKTYLPALKINKQAA